jgi:DNA-binding transcriptional LysR family regulator
MQQGNWNDLRYLLAIKRGQTLAAAARQLSVDDTTVSRRLAALQSAFGAQLFVRHADGTLALTPIGDAMVDRAEIMERQFNQIGGVVEADRDPCVGTVRLTSVPIVVNRLLVPAAKALLDRHPRLQMELIPDSRNLSLTRCEADLAIRIGRPTAGGSTVKARRVGTLCYSAYMSMTYSPREAARLAWITYGEAMSRLPQAQWIARAAKGRGPISGLRVHDAETALEAVVAGLGKTLLPSVIGDRDRRLQRFDLDEREGRPAREIWLLAHSKELKFTRIAAAIAWVEETLRGETARAVRYTLTSSSPARAAARSDRHGLPSGSAPKQRAHQRDH